MKIVFTRMPVSAALAVLALVCVYVVAQYELSAPPSVITDAAIISVGGSSLFAIAGLVCVALRKRSLLLGASDALAICIVGYIVWLAIATTSQAFQQFTF